MKIDFTKKTHFVSMVLLVEAVVFGGIAAVLPHSSLAADMPDSVRLWGAITRYIVCSWFFIAHRPK